MQLLHYTFDDVQDLNVYRFLPSFSWSKLSGQLPRQLEERPWGDRLGDDDWRREPNLLFFQTEVKSVVVPPIGPSAEMFGRTCAVSAFPSPSLASTLISSVLLISLNSLEDSAVVHVCTTFCSPTPHSGSATHGPRSKKTQSGRALPPTWFCHPDCPDTPAEGGSFTSQKTEQTETWLSPAPVCISLVGYMSFQGIFSFVLTTRLWKYIKRKRKGSASISVSLPLSLSPSLPSSLLFMLAVQDVIPLFPDPVPILSMLLWPLTLCNCKLK